MRVDLERLHPGSSKAGGLDVLGSVKSDDSILKIPVPGERQSGPNQAPYI